MLRNWYVAVYQWYRVHGFLKITLAGPKSLTKYQIDSVTLNVMVKRKHGFLFVLIPFIFIECYLFIAFRLIFGSQSQKSGTGLSTIYRSQVCSMQSLCYIIDGVSGICSYGTPVGSENSHYSQSQFQLDFLQALWRTFRDNLSHAQQPEDSNKTTNSIKQ